jgi:hypothetical protein
MELLYIYNSAMKLGQTYIVTSTIIVTSIFSHSTTVMAQVDIEDWNDYQIGKKKVLSNKTHPLNSENISSVSV